MLTPHIGDSLNACFELIGALAQASNVCRLLRDRAVKGVVWQFWMFYFTWGCYNCWYYPSLHQWCSFVAGVMMTVSNLVWVGLAIRFTYGEPAEG